MIKHITKLRNDLYTTSQQTEKKNLQKDITKNINDNEYFNTINTTSYF
jgi:hypothetical protein